MFEAVNYVVAKIGIDYLGGKQFLCVCGDKPKYVWFHECCIFYSRDIAKKYARAYDGVVLEFSLKELEK